jgi:hypothetical protein
MHERDVEKGSEAKAMTVDDDNWEVHASRHRVVSAKQMSEEIRGVQRVK